MNSLKTILAAVDFGKSSEAALAQALRIGCWSKAEVHALYVVDTGVLVEAQEALTMLQQDIQRELEAGAAKRWAGFATGLPDRADCRFHVVVNDARHALADLAEQIGAGLLVMGVSGDDDGGRGPGPLTTAVLQRAKCPVLLAQEGQAGAFKSVVACVDFSPMSERALNAAARVALKDGSELHVLHVYRAPWHESRLLMLPRADLATRGRYVDGLRQKIDAMWARLGGEFAGLKPRIEVMEHSSHGRGIVQYGESVGADLIVLGTRGRTNLRDVLLGSTAERVIRSAGRSVLAVH